MCCFHFNTLFIEDDKIVIPRKDVRQWTSVFDVNHKLLLFIIRCRWIEPAKIRRRLQTRLL